MRELKEAAIRRNMEEIARLLDQTIELLEATSGGEAWELQRFRAIRALRSARPDVQTARAAVTW